MTPRVWNKHTNTPPPGSVYVGRGSDWGNPYRIGFHGTREEVIELYRKNVLPMMNLEPLRGRHLVCFCKPAACHGDLLLEAVKQKYGAYQED